MKRPAFRLPTGRSLAFAALLGTATNWQGNVAPSNNGANVVFTDQYFAAGGGNLNLNLEHNWSFNTVTFAGGGSFLLGTTTNRGCTSAAASTGTVRRRRPSPCPPS